MITVWSVFNQFISLLYMLFRQLSRKKELDHISAILNWIWPSKGRNTNLPLQPVKTRRFSPPYPSSPPRLKPSNGRNSDNRYQHPTPLIHSMITAGAQSTLLSGLPFNPLSLPLSFSQRRFPTAVFPAPERCRILRWIVRAEASQSMVPLQSENGRSVSQVDDARPPFDINLAVVLAGFAFEAYNSPPVSASSMLDKYCYWMRMNLSLDYVILRGDIYDLSDLIQRVSDQLVSMIRLDQLSCKKCKGGFF